MENKPAGKGCSRLFKMLCGRRYSLAKIITSGFIAIVILFLIVVVLFSYRLQSVQSLLGHITEESFPEMTYSNAIHSQVNELLYFSSHLVGANTDVGLRITKGKIDAKIANIKKQIMEHDNNQNQLNQLQVISQELDNLHDLVKQKRERQDLIIVDQNKLYLLHEAVFKLLQNIPSQVDASSSTADWILTYSEVITLTSKGLIKQRLQEVRQTLFLVQQKIDLLRKEIISLPKESQSIAISLTNELQQLLLEDNGLLLLKIDQLRIIGRVVGRDNFVKNLIDDFSRDAEFRAYQINTMLVNETDAIVAHGKRDVKLISLISLLIFMLLFVVIVFIQQWFVKRIVTLNKKVMARLYGHSGKIEIGGNDEISDIADAFDFFAVKVEQQKHSLEALSLTDGLTGIPNRRALDQRLAYDLKAANRHSWSEAVMLMDIDFFKKYNDTYGHIAGDTCLRHISYSLSHHLTRAIDFVARYGGEEFIFLLPNTDLLGAQKVANAIIRQIAILQIEHQSSDIADYVTLSIGITIFTPDDKRSTQCLLEDADRALYEAKSNGRNRWSVYQPEESHLDKV